MTRTGRAPVVSAGVCAVLLAACAAGAPPDRRADVTAADALEAKLAGLVRPGPPGSRVVLLESELNAFLRLGRAGLPPWVRRIEGRLVDGAVELSAEVESARLAEHADLGGSVPVMLLPEVVGLALTARASGADGWGRVDVESARIGWFPVPPAAVRRLVLEATRDASHAGFDIAQPWPLPRGIQRLRAEPGRVVLEY